MTKEILAILFIALISAVSEWPAVRRGSKQFDGMEGCKEPGTVVPPREIWPPRPSGAWLLLALRRLLH
jgi:hypothetical protein